MEFPGHKTTKQAAEILGIRVDSLRRAVRKNKILPAFRIGRAMVFTDEEVLRYRDDPERYGRPKKEKERTNEAAAPTTAATTTDTPSN